MTEPPDRKSVCAVVVTHRRPDDLAKSLDVLSAQTRPVDHPSSSTTTSTNRTPGSEIW